MTDVAVSPGPTGMDPSDPSLELLRQLGAADPRLQILMQLMRQRQTVPPAEPADTQGAVDRLTAANERLRGVCRALRARVDYLAAALGACARCWGEDEECPLCDGRGVPGAFQPHPGAFEACVVPAIRRRDREPAPSVSRSA